MRPQLRVFVSHCHEDDAFCRVLVQAMREAGADVWYDEHNMGSGELLDTIERELRARPVFVVILSPAALRSQWVRDECKWAYTRYKRDPTRIIQPVLAAALPDDGTIWMFLHDFKRIEAPNLHPWPKEEAVRRTLRSLALTPAGEEPSPSTPQSSETADELIARGKAFPWKPNDATTYFVRATELAPDSFDAWANLSRSYAALKNWNDSLGAADRALAIDNTQSFAWHTRGDALLQLQRYEEALDAYEHTLARDKQDAAAWVATGNTLNHLGRYQEALQAYNHALAEKPSDVLYHDIWVGKCTALNGLQRYEEALIEINRALTRYKTASKLRSKATALRGLGRTGDAEKAERSAKVLEQH